MRKWHPDICDEPNAEKIAKKINEANDILKKYLKGNTFGAEYNFKNTEQYNSINIKISEVMHNLVRLTIIDFSENEINLFDDAIMETSFDLGMLLLMAEIDLRDSESMEALEGKHIKYKKLILIAIKNFIKQYCSDYSLNITSVDNENYVIESEYKINIENGMNNVYNTLRQASNNRNILKRVFVKTKQFFKS